MGPAPAAGSADETTTETTTETVKDMALRDRDDGTSSRTCPPGAAVRESVRPRCAAIWAALLACAAMQVPFGAPAKAQVEDLPLVQPAVRAKPAGGGAWSAEVNKQRVAPATRARATAIRITGDGARTLVRLEVTRPVVASMFTLDEPYRAIVDVADLDFQLPANAGTRGSGLIKAFRYGQFEAGRSRLVLDLAAPATIEKAAFIAPAGNEPGVLTFELARVGAAEFRVMRGPAAPETDAAAAVPKQLRGARHEEQPAVPRPSDDAKTRPVIVIDPGHGGIDPGTVAVSGQPEKNVTLAVAIQLRNILQQSRRYDIVMTRQTDVFVSLDQRVKLSRQQGADLFVSIHADALAEKGMAQAVNGATVYTLGDRASDETARRLAEKENAADVLAGLAAVPASTEDQVRSILLDLVQRETANYSASFRTLLLSNMQGRVPLSKDPPRSAAFKVLKQPDVPSVLIELGYMSNTEDLARLGKAEGQRQLAAAIAASVDAFFAKRDARAGR